MSKNTIKKCKSVICRDTKTGRFISCKHGRIHIAAKRKERKTDGTGPKRK